MMCCSAVAAKLKSSLSAIVNKFLLPDSAVSVSNSVHIHVCYSVLLLISDLQHLFMCHYA